MSLDTATKQAIMTEYATVPADTGSPEVQVALLNASIKNLTEHLKVHRHDKHTQRGLMVQIGKQRRLLNYLAHKDISRYRALVAKLGIRSKH